MISNLYLRGGALSGSVAGKGLNCVLQPFQGGRGPAPGKYAVRPIDSPIFGQAAVLVPLSSPQGARVSTQAHEFHRPGGVQASWDWGNNGPWGRQAAATGMRGAASGVTTWDDFFRPGATQCPDWWVISGRPIAGRKCLTAPLGHAELMAAVRAAQVELTVY